MPHPSVKSTAKSSQVGKHAVVGDRANVRRRLQHTAGERQANGTGGSRKVYERLGERQAKVEYWRSDQRNRRTHV